MSGLTNGYLEEVGKKLLGEKFLGSFPSDMQPKIRNRSKFYIIFNLSRVDEMGTHFIAIFANKNNLFYFDPLGNKCYKKDILTFITKYSKNRKVRKKFPKIQSNNSIFCGFYCLAFLLSMKLDLPLKSFFKLFNINSKLTSNDEIVINFIKDNVL